VGEGAKRTRTFLFIVGKDRPLISLMKILPDFFYNFMAGGDFDDYSTTAATIFIFAMNDFYCPAL
jgi:hypothetical protein